MRAGARLKTMIQISNKLSRADPEKTTGVSVPASLGLNTDEPAQIQPPSHQKAKICGWDNARGAVGSLQHTVRTTWTAAFKDKAL